MKTFFERLLGMPFSLRQKRLARRRPALTEMEFVTQVTEQGGDSTASVALWRMLRDWIYVPEFTPYPNDSLGSVFGIAEEELDEDLILGILRELELAVPSSQTILDFGAVDTPLRVAVLVALCRKQAQPPSSSDGVPRGKR
jgi:hypothetical protein